MANPTANPTNLESLANALKTASDGKFLATEHASSIFKKALKDAGFETTKKEKQIVAEIKQV